MIADDEQSTLGEAGSEPEFDFVTGDLSFISLTLVLPALVPFLKTGGNLLALVKPQFELQPGQVGKGGIVRDPALYAVVERRIRDACESLGLTVAGWFDSPIAGGDGNREFLSGPASGPMNEWKEARYGHERSRDAPGREGHHRGASASEF